MLAASFLAVAIFAQAASTTRPDTVPVAIPPATPTVARVTFDFGNGSVAPVTVTGFEFVLAGAPTGAATAAASSATRAPDHATTSSALVAPGSTIVVTAQGALAQVQFARTPDSLTAELVQHGASGQHIAAVTIDVLGDRGAVAMTMHLADVVVASDRVAVDDTRASLAQQQLSLLDAIAQGTADLDEAERQRNLTEALDKKRLSSSLEVARVHSQVELARKRLANDRERLVLLDSRIASAAPILEHVTLGFTHFDIQTAQPPRP